jgi:transcriptional regulator with XRE-family HTH domain
MTLESATRTVFHELLAQKKMKNPSFSLRALARQFGVSHTYLSLVIAGKKPPSQNLLLQLTEKTGIDPRALATQGADSARPPGYEPIEVDQFRLMSEWYHLPLLDLIRTRGFKPEPEWIAKRLGISRREVEVAKNRLVRLGMLEINEAGSWRKTKRMLIVPTTRSHASVRNFHQTMIRKAGETLEANDDFNGRSITGTTLSLNPRKIPAAKKMIAAFEEQLLRFLTQGTCTEVFQLNIQLFQLTENGANK